GDSPARHMLDRVPPTTSPGAPGVARRRRSERSDDGWGTSSRVSAVAVGFHIGEWRIVRRSTNPYPYRRGIASVSGWIHPHTSCGVAYATTGMESSATSTSDWKRFCSEAARMLQVRPAVEQVGDRQPHRLDRDPTHRVAEREGRVP